MVRCFDYPETARTDLKGDRQGVLHNARWEAGSGVV
jgi:hypothetical protein